MKIDFIQLLKKNESTEKFAVLLLIPNLAR